MSRNRIANKEDGPHDDSRATDLLHYIFSRSDLEDIRGSPTKVIAAIDEYSNNHKFLMNVGPDKGAHVVSVIQQQTPSTMVELGAFVGYSAILFGNAVRENGGKQYFSLEINPVFAAVSSLLLDLAGLRGFVQILIAPSHVSLARFVHDDLLENGHIDLLFIDHWQRLYLPDLWLVEQLRLLKPGVSIVVADNTLLPGAPEYLDWVRASPAEKREKLKSSKAIEIDNLVDIVKRGGDEFARVDLQNVLGNPKLIYETSSHRYPLLGQEDALEVTKFVGENEL